METNCIVPSKGVEIAVGNTVGIDVGNPGVFVVVAAIVAVGTNNCRVPQLEINRLKTKIQIVTFRCLVFITTILSYFEGVCLGRRYKRTKMRKSYFVNLRENRPWPEVPI